ncbi:hypothetical protein RJ639_010406 [Escallonia herrerae]|uniref:Protein SIEVE ELEMENT OCCLUSION B-like n=1 Tax=Escallonia herrerae TaxID=1293975 RepID=A0AA88VT06_9ASTE|nr:hypothetical protein RJ639_010406 [Escallonia herrerae]
MSGTKPEPAAGQNQDLTSRNYPRIFESDPNVKQRAQEAYLEQPQAYLPRASISNRPALTAPMQSLYKGDRSMLMGSDESLIKQIEEAYHVAGRDDINIRPLLSIVEDILRRATISAPADAILPAGTQAQPETPEYKATQYSLTAIMEQVSPLIDRIACEMACHCSGGTDINSITLSLFRDMLQYFPWDAKLVLTLAALALNYGEFWLLAQIYPSNQLAKSMATLKQVPAIMERTTLLKARFDALNTLIKSILDLTRTIVTLKDLPTLHISKDVPPLSTAYAAIPSAVYWSVKSIVVSASYITGLTATAHDQYVVFVYAPSVCVDYSSLDNLLRTSIKSCNLCIARWHIVKCEDTLNLVNILIKLKVRFHEKTVTEVSWSKLRFSTSSTLEWELSSLTHKIDRIHDDLKKLLAECRRITEEKQRNKVYDDLLGMLRAPIDNMPILRLLLNPKDDPLPLVEGTLKTRVRHMKQVRLEVLARKMVLLLISSLDISQDELSILEQIYNESRPREMEIQFEMVWVPIVDPDVRSSSIDRSVMSKRLETQRSTMKWYSVFDPYAINPVVIRFFRDQWHYKYNPILVVLDPQGALVSPNAMHMMLIWGSAAFPFTKSRERELWSVETWRVDLLVNLDNTIFSWVRSDKYFFLYGGDDVEWIRSFTRAVKLIADDAKITIEMAYVGKANKGEQVRRAFQTIRENALSYCWSEVEMASMMWFFWTRLESMFFSKIQIEADDRDSVLTEVKKLLSLDKMDRGWAMFCKGSTVIFCGHGGPVLQATQEYFEQWKVHVPIKGFEKAYKDHHDGIHIKTLPCCRFEFSTIAGKIPERIACPECTRLMEKYMTFLCCHNEAANINTIY